MRETFYCAQLRGWQKMGGEAFFSLFHHFIYIRDQRLLDQYTIFTNLSRIYP